MSVRRISILLEREIIRGPKNFLFIFALVVPLAVSLLVSLVFGNLFSGKPRLAIVDPGSSQFTALVREDKAILLKEFATEDELIASVRRGASDLGVVFPVGFDEALSRGNPFHLKVYQWGESELRDRVILSTTTVVLLRQMVGQEAPVEIVTETLGDGESVPWEDRLLPFIVMMAVLIGGLMVPATSIVEEKQRRTLKALTTTPTTLGDVLAAKGLLGVLISVAMGVLILLINRAFGNQPLLLVGVMALGAMMAACIGVIFGIWVKDIDTLFATIKGLGIFLYAPALVYMFPEIPQWIGRIFPTYYMIAPIVEITQRGATFEDVVVDLVILAALIGVLVAGVGLLGRRVQVLEA